MRKPASVLPATVSFAATHVATGRPATLPNRARWYDRLRHLAITVTAVFSEHPWLAGTVLVVAVWTVRQLVLHYTTNPFSTVSPGEYQNYISDQEGGPNLMADWQQGFRQVSVVSADNFFLKYPLYLLGDNLPFGPPKQLFLESWVLLAIIVALILRAAGLCLSQVAARLSVPRRFPLAMLVVSLALAATPFANFHWLEFTNSRNIEVGLGFYLLARLYLYVGGYASGRSVWLTHWTSPWLAVCSLTIRRSFTSSLSPLYSSSSCTPSALPRPNGASMARGPPSQ